MKVLGLSCFFHDSAAALVVDGEVVAAAAEERFTRVKHDNSFPERAIGWCLEEAGISVDQIDAICFYEKPLRKLERVLAVGKRWQGAGTEHVEQQLGSALSEGLFVEDIIRARLGYEGPVYYTTHHLAHAASAYFASGFDEAALLTVDGVGEWATTTTYHAHGHRVRALKEIYYPHSIGMLYSAITAYLGFKPNSDEYKVMGLASYGQPTRVAELEKLFTVLPDGSFRIHTEYFDFTHSATRMYGDKLVELLGPARIAGDEVTDAQRDLASSLQKVTEDVLVNIAQHLQQETGLKKLCLAGGVALNCVANWKIVERTAFEEVSIQPAAGDDGGSVGAALYAWHTLTQSPPKARDYYETRLGPSFEDSEIQAFLDERGIDYESFEDEQSLCERTAELIAEDQIVGWFQGRMEFGPRALGSRSILANPANPDMKDILNSRIKFREEFRPFAPAVVAERADEFFVLDRPSPYMLLTPQVGEGWGEKLPSITHVDNSARVQTVEAERSPRFHRLIENVGRKTGVPVVINTSFNVKGEPIVCTPEDAYKCFMRTDMDCLVMGSYVIEKAL